MSRRMDDFDVVCLAEAHRHDAQALTPDGPAAVREALALARSGAGSADERMRVWARALAERNGLAEALPALVFRQQVTLGVLGVLFALSGLGAALAVLGDGSRAVNVVWALGGLLGVHVLSLLLWALTFWLSARGGGLLARLWQGLAAWGAGGTVARLTGAVFAVMARSGLQRWWLGAVTHVLWLAFLMGSLAGLLIGFSVRRYDFVWESTLLSAEVFEYFVTLLGSVPAALSGLGMPDVGLVRVTGEGAGTGTGLAGGLDEAGRRLWANWMIGCVLVYGVLLRLSLWALCFVRWRLGRRRVRLDLHLPEFVQVVGWITPESERIGVTDAAPAQLHEPPPAAVTLQAGGRPVLLGLELEAPVDWPRPLSGMVLDGGIIDGRAARRQALEQLGAQPPARLLLVCNARLSPDRGSLALVADLARHAAQTRVLLEGADPGDGEGADERGADRRGAMNTEGRQRVAYWRQGLMELGFAADQVFGQAAAALSWLEQGDEQA